MNLCKDTLMMSRKCRNDRKKGGGGGGGERTENKPTSTTVQKLN